MKLNEGKTRELELLRTKYLGDGSGKKELDILKKDANGELDIESGLPPVLPDPQKREVDKRDHEENEAAKKVATEALKKQKKGYRKTMAHTVAFVLLFHLTAFVQDFNTIPSFIKCTYKRLILWVLIMPSSIGISKQALLAFKFVQCSWAVDKNEGKTFASLSIASYRNLRMVVRVILNLSVIVGLIVLTVELTEGSYSIVCFFPDTPSPMPTPVHHH